MAVKLTEEERKLFAGNSRLRSYFEKNLEQTYRELAVTQSEPLVRCLQGQAQFLQSFVDQMNAQPAKPAAQKPSADF